MKTKILKRVMSVLCAVTMAVSFAISSTAINITEGEIAFSMAYMRTLPKRKGNGFDIFTSLDYLNLKDKEVYEYEEYPIHQIKKITIEQKKVFQQIETLVKQLEKEVERETSESLRYIGTSDDYSSRSMEMRKAEKIYRWVAENIPYEDTEAPQDPLFVFNQRTGVCVGKANLVNLMMRIAKIPCAVIRAPHHSYNAVYLEEVEENRKGWTLLDATWGASKSDMEKHFGGKTVEEDKLKKFFPAFYQKSIDFETANRGIIDLPSHRIMGIVSCGNQGYFLKNESYSFDLQSNKATYVCFVGSDGRPYVVLEGNKENPSEEVELRPDVMDCGMNIFLKSGVRSLILREDTSLDLVDLSGASDLISVNTENSNKYISDAVALYERNDIEPNKKGKMLKLFKNGRGTIGEDGLRYCAFTEDDKVTKIEVYFEEPKDVKIRIPESLREMHVPIKIGGGIKSLILEGDDIVDLGSAYSLETIDVKHSNKYMLEDNVLYERKADGQKGDKVTRYEPEEDAETLDIL